MQAAQTPTLKQEIRERQAQFLAPEYREQKMKEYLASVATQIKEAAALGMTQRTFLIANPKIAGIVHRGRKEALEKFFTVNDLNYDKYTKYCNKTTTKKTLGELLYIKYIVHFDPLTSDDAMLANASSSVTVIKQYV